MIGWPESGGCRHDRVVDGGGRGFVTLGYMTCIEMMTCVKRPLYLVVVIHTDFLVSNCLVVSGKCYHLVVTIIAIKYCSRYDLH